MLVENEQTFARYRGMNPKLCHRVWAERRADERERAAKEHRKRLAEIQEQRKRERQALEQEALARKAKELREKLVREKTELLVQRFHGFREPNTELVTAKDIIHRIAAETGVPYRDIIGVRRSHPIIHARFLAIRAVADAKPHMSLPAIGRVFNRDHTSILHALRKTRRPGQVR